MSSLKRTIKRKKMNKKKKMAQKEMAAKVALFGQLGDQCLTCQKPFDKMNKEQVMSWNVVVREQEEKINLYCPDCWQNAIDLLKDFKKHLEGKNE
jgi:nitrate/TMAO reductase-like tetraheme cytochrome c subunit